MTWRAIPARPWFLELINSGELPTGRALVAGCGRGYAVAALASAARSVTGLEISDTAKAAADEYLATALAGDGSPAAEHCAVVVDDFFTHAPAEGWGPADVDDTGASVFYCYGT